MDHFFPVRIQIKIKYVLSRRRLILFYLGEGWLWWDMGENMLGPRKGSKCGFYSGSSRHQNYDFWWGVRGGGYLKNETWKGNFFHLLSYLQSKNLIFPVEITYFRNSMNKTVNNILGANMIFQGNIYTLQYI